MKKHAQDFSFYQPALSDKTLGDLLAAIRADTGLPIGEKGTLVNQLKALTGYANESTPLSALMMKGLGGTIGWLISKYFGMGPVGQVVSALAGYGIGSMINDQLNQPPSIYGYKKLASDVSGELQKASPSAQPMTIHMPGARRDQTDVVTPRPGDDPRPTQDRGVASNRNKIDPDLSSNFNQYGNAAPPPAKSMPPGASSVSVNSKKPITPSAGKGMAGET